MTEPVSDISLHHTAIVVGDLQKSLAFYEGYFGGAVETILRDVGDPQIAELHQLDDARFTLAFVKFGNSRLELFQFEHPGDGAAVSDRAHDFGVRHVCFEVADVRQAYAEMSAAGVVFTRPPYELTEGDARGTVLAFCFDPDGTRVELLQPGPGL
jgi:catechol 2,3-dioxygenase-like lactoylglutathione lyase family enzyme